MKILKTFFIVLVVLAALFVIVGLFLPSKFHIERSAVISAPQEQLFEQVNDVKNWNNWSAWNKLDPNWKVTYSEATSGTGASFSWISENEQAGNGKITITKSEPFNSVEATMEFEGMNPATLYHKFEAVEGGTKVTLGMNADIGSNIMAKYMLNIWGDKMVGGRYDESLKYMEEYIKNNPKQAAPEPVIENTDSLNNGDSANLAATPQE